MTCAVDGPVARPVHGPADDAVGRAARWARCYPRRWRRQYPDFVEVLAADLAAHPARVRRDVLVGAVVERLRAAAVLPSGPADRGRSGLGLVGAALVPFAGLVAGMWSQLHTGLSRPGPAAPPVLRTAELLLAVGAVVAVGSLALAVAAVVGSHFRRAGGAGGTGGRAPGWSGVGPALVFTAAMAVLSVAGWAAERSGWYTPAAVALPGRGVGHLLTLWMRGVVAAITPAWVHPGILERMPAGALCATCLAPVAVLVAAAALLRTVARLPLRPPGRAGLVGVVLVVGTMLVSLAACVRWLLGLPVGRGAAVLPARTGALAVGHTGWAVAALLAGLAATATVGARRVLQGGPGPARPSCPGR